MLVTNHHVGSEQQASWTCRTQSRKHTNLDASTSCQMTMTMMDLIEKQIISEDSMVVYVHASLVEVYWH